MAALQGIYVILTGGCSEGLGAFRFFFKLRAIGLEGVVGHVARYQGNRLGAQDRSSLFLTIPFVRTVITFQTHYVTHGPRASSVQVDSGIAACASM